jgi:hypothetical protein
VTWTKLGDEFGTESRDLTDAEFRTHVEALCWSNWRLLDLHIPKRDIQRFTESPAAAGAIEGLAVKGWWQDRGDTWYIGVRFPEWQRSRAQVESRRAYLAEAKRQSRKRQAEAAQSTVDSTVDSTADPGRDGTGTTYPAVPPTDLGQDQGQVQRRPHASVARRDSGGTTPSPDGVKASNSVALASEHNGSEPDGPDDQQIPIEVHLQSQTTDRNARETTP